MGFGDLSFVYVNQGKLDLSTKRKSESEWQN